MGSVDGKVQPLDDHHSKLCGTALFRQCELGASLFVSSPAGHGLITYSYVAPLPFSHSLQLYSWSIFNSAQDRVWGRIGANADAFTVAVAVEGFVACFLGSIIEKVSMGTIPVLYCMCVPELCLYVSANARPTLACSILTHLDYARLGRLTAF